MFAKKTLQKFLTAALTAGLLAVSAAAQQVELSEKAPRTVSLDDILVRAGERSCTDRIQRMSLEHFGLLRDMYGVSGNNVDRSRYLQCMNAVGVEEEAAMFATDEDRLFILRSNEIFECTNDDAVILRPACRRE